MKVLDTIGAAAGASLSIPSALGALLIAVSAVLVAVPVPAAQAAGPIRVSYPVDVSYQIPELTAGCGFDVTFSMTGTFAGLIFHNSSGDIVSELDTQPGTKITFSSSTTGRSFTYPFSTVFHAEYPEGTNPGDPVVARVTGFVEKTPGLPAAAGNMRFTGGTVLFVENGIPYVNYGYPTSFRGRQNEAEAVDAAICAALAP